MRQRLVVGKLASRLFVDHCFQEPAVAYVEAPRGTFNPTYLYYTLGKLEIQELAAYMRNKGATLKQFHDAFVAQGALPIPLVRQILLHPGGESSRKRPPGKVPDASLDICSARCPA